MEREASIARENGESMSADFWAAFGVAHASVSLAERAVSKAKEGK